MPTVCPAAAAVSAPAPASVAASAPASAGDGEGARRLGDGGGVARSTGVPRRKEWTSSEELGIIITYLEGVGVQHGDVPIGAAGGEVDGHQP